MKAIGAVIGAAVVLPVLFLLMIVMPSQQAASCQGGGGGGGGGGVAGYTKAQMEVATKIVQGSGVDNDQVHVILVAIAIAATDLTPEAGVYVFNGQGTKLSIKEQAAAMVEFMGQAPDAWTYSPLEYVAVSTGLPVDMVAPVWDDAISIVAAVTEQDDDDVETGNGADTFCNEELWSAWNDGEVTVTNGAAEPLIGGLRVSSHFGWRTDPITGERRLHGGTDYPAPCESRIVAVWPGMVTMAEVQADGAGVVEIRHDNGVRTRYVHMKGKNIFVREGMPVGMGQIIALVGTEGHSTGCHLHFGVYTKEGKLVDSRTVFDF